MSLCEQIHEMGRKAQIASRELAVLPTETKNSILNAMADGLMEAESIILEANAQDLQNAIESELGDAMIDRLRLDANRLASVSEGVRQVASLDDPVGLVMDEWQRPNGISIQQRRVPIGVIGIIFESRPNVTSDAATLCLKSGNATLLRGGKEAIHSNRAIANVLQEAGTRAGLPANSIQLVPSTDREGVRYLAEMDQYLDLIIPRGGKGLIEAVVSLARMPVIKHYDGVCHVYVHQDADQDMAQRIVVDSKIQKPSACNALETLLVDQKVAATFLPSVAGALAEQGVEIRGCDQTCRILGDRAILATQEDWHTEYLDLVVSIRVVDDCELAVEHINQFGSRHSDCIVTRDSAAAQYFQSYVDSAVVFWNASTRFNDGEEFGFGAEIGISTDKLHARGPMALRELTSYKYLVQGNGQTKSTSSS